jgi:hypothetical protein
MPTFESSIVAEARRVARLQARQRTLRRQLRDVGKELRLAKKNLRALAGAKNDPFEQSQPLRGFGEQRATGT